MLSTLAKKIDSIKKLSNNHLMMITDEQYKMIDIVNPNQPKTNQHISIICKFILDNNLKGNILNKQIIDALKPSQIMELAKNGIRVDYHSKINKLINI